MVFGPSDIHRAHPSSIPQENQANFGFCLSWWDRILKTYIPQTALGHLGREIGLPDQRDQKAIQIDVLLTQPFRTPYSGS
ncbi:MAG: hypothetical protein A2508_04970 [Candidatus Lambdaproteobacteria bacterium RIFOXYD12_FULL_49_8]|nr:MAG: hypothetical protein A2508_04970 [Candidatus Lambdaproteobacteria bacterium RIFOXYD12_FULL_49_8]